MVNGFLQALILAAGKSSRFKTSNTKLGYTLCGQEIILYPVKLLQALGIPTTVVVGYQKEKIKHAIHAQAPAVNFIDQDEQKGNANAVLCTQKEWLADNILIMNGDAPLVTEDLINQLIQRHKDTQATVTFITAHNTDPLLNSYSRVITRNGKTSLVEAHNFSGDVATDCCVNADIYLIKKDFLEKTLSNLTPSNNGETSLTELVSIAYETNHKVEMVKASFDQVRAVKTLKELWTAEHIKRSELIGYWMDQGVHFSAAQNVYIDLNAKIGAGSFIGAGVLLLEGTVIGENCMIDAFSFISNSTIRDNATVAPHCVITDSEVQSYAHVGPFAHIRNQSVISEHATIGNFVEVSKTIVGSHSKAKHLSYLGNGVIGSHVNIGAGTILCNYNGFTKNTTTIKDHAYIGSNNSLVAPLVIGEHAITGAGSVLTHDVPAHSLALGRAQQINKEGYATVLKERFKAEKKKDQQLEDPLNNSFLGAHKTSTMITPEEK